MNKNVIVMLIAMLFALFGFSQQDENPMIEKLDEVVITDTRFKIKKENSGKTVIKIDLKPLKGIVGKLSLKLSIRILE